MKVFKFIAPYTADGKTKFPERGRTGVYLIKENGKIVYIGYSLNDLYKTMYRHFQTWNHTGQEVVSYNAKGSDTYTVRVVYCTPQQADRLERYLIRKHKPRDNKYIYELNFRDRNTGEQYENSDPQTPKFTAAELKVQEEDKAYFEELERGGAAMFGIKPTKINKGRRIYKTTLNAGLAKTRLQKFLDKNQIPYEFYKALTKSYYFDFSINKDDFNVRISNHTSSLQPHEHTPDNYTESSLREREYNGEKIYEFDIITPEGEKMLYDTLKKYV